MERRHLLQSVHSEYNSCTENQGYARQSPNNVDTWSRDNAASFSHSQINVRLSPAESNTSTQGSCSPCFVDAQESLDITDYACSGGHVQSTCSNSLRPKHRTQSQHSCSADYSLVVTPDHSDNDGQCAIAPQSERKSRSQHNRTNDINDNKDKNKIVGDVDVIPKQKTRMLLLAFIGFFTTCSSKIFTPVMTQYTYQVYTEQVFGNLSVGVHIAKHPCVNTSDQLMDSKTQQVQDLSGAFLSRTVLIGGGMAIFINLFLGSYSDVMGRKMVLLFPLLGLLLRNAAAPVVIYFDLGLPGMYVGYLLEGLFGGTMAMILGLYVYASDITEKGSERTMGLALVEAAMGLGDSCMRVVAGLFIQDMGFFYPALVATLLLVIGVILVCFLPETVTRDRSKLISPLKTVQRMIGTFLPRDNAYRRAMLLLAISAFFVNTLPMMSLTTLESLYLMDKPFCWNSLQQGILGTVRDTSSYVTCLAVIRLVSKAISTPLLVIIGLVFDMAKGVAMALATDDLDLYMVAVAGLLRKLIYPSMRSFMSSLVPRDRQGAMFAGIAALESLCVCIGSMTFVYVYKVTMTFMKGFVFLSMAAIQVLVLLVYIINTHLYRQFKASRRIVISIQAEDENTEQDSVGEHLTIKTT